MKNSHIFEFLDYYVELSHSPQYAVMIDGAWGIGKTYCVNSYIEHLKKSGKRVIYVSLYGAKDIEDIDLSIALGVHPSLNTKIASYGGRLAKAVGKNFGFGVEVTLTDFLDKTAVDLLVFDDLERSKLSPADTLGYINTFVEHEGMKVLVVANEGKLSVQKKYGLLREKVVGMTFKLQQCESDAIDAFIGQATDPNARKSLSESRENILSIFQQSKMQNLRILKQTVWAWDRFYKCIEAEHLNKTKGMVAALKLFFALSFEVRSGRLGEGDLTDRVDKIVAGQMGKREGDSSDGTPLSQAQERYAQLHLNDAVLTDEVLVQLLCEGRNDCKKINESLSKSEHFIQPENEPAWQTVWHGITRTEDEFSKAFSKMESQFKKREFIDAGEVLHVFGLRLWCSEMKQLNKTAREVVEECQVYVDDLFTKKKILEGATRGFKDGMSHGAFGLGFMGCNSEEFREVYQHYTSRVEDAERALWPKHVEDLLALMVSNVDLFFQKVCWTNDDRENTFYNIPVFSTASGQRFVDHLMEIHPADQRTVLTALRGRYSMGVLEREKVWLTEVRDELYKRAAKLPPIRKYAIRNEVGRLIDQLLVEEDAS